MPKISIIIPVYGVEKYIERCCVSVFEQTYKNFELIFVNDCSKDNSEKILLNLIERYAHLNININHIKHEVNKGISATRETGLNAAKGEYILYVDSDDYIAPNMLELLVNRADETNADIVYCDYYDLKNGELIYQNQSLSVKDSLLITAAMLRSEIVWTPWNKIFKKSLATEHNIHWSLNINVGEDLVVMAKLFEKKKKIEFVNQALYIYNRDNVNSYLNSWNTSSCQQNLKAIEVINDFFSKELLNSMLLKSLDRIKLIGRFQMLYTFESKLFKQIYKTFPETNSLIFSYKNTSLYWKIILFLVVNECYVLAKLAVNVIFLFKKTKSYIHF